MLTKVCIIKMSKPDKSTYAVKSIQALQSIYEQRELSATYGIKIRISSTQIVVNKINTLQADVACVKGAQLGEKIPVNDFNLMLEWMEEYHYYATSYIVDEENELGELEEITVYELSYDSSLPEPLRVSVMYAMEGGDPIITDTQRYGDGDTIFVSSTVPEKEGFTFLGYDVYRGDILTEHKNPGDMWGAIVNENESSNYILKAKWE